MVLVAADGFRLGERQVELPSEVATPLKLMIPAKAMIELARLIGKKPKDTLPSVSITGDTCVFSYDNVELAIRLGEGNYPDYKVIFPKHHTTHVTAHIEQFLKACKTLSKIQNSRVELILKVDESGLTLIAKDADGVVDPSQIKIPTTLIGKPMTIAFNKEYLIDGLGAISAPEVALELTTPTSPGVLRPLGKDDYQYITMPMHLGK